MTDRQKYALENPVYAKGQRPTGLDRHDYPFGTVVETIAIDTPQSPVAAWHVTVSALAPDMALVPTTKWTNKLRRRVLHQALELIEGVGDPESDISKDSEVALHLFRVLKPEEAARLPVEFAAEAEHQWKAPAPSAEPVGDKPATG